MPNELPPRRTGSRTSPRHLRHQLLRIDRRERRSWSTGANVMGQQRGTQNGADAASEAGTVVIAQYLMGGRVGDRRHRNWPDDAGRPMGPRGLQGRLRISGTEQLSRSAWRTVHGLQGSLRSERWGAGTTPGPEGAGRPGVRQSVSSTRTSLARSACPTFTATTQATAVTGTVYDAVAQSDSTCGCLFPDHRAVRKCPDCDNTGKVVPGTGPLAIPW